MRNAWLGIALALVGCGGGAADRNADPEADADAVPEPAATVPAPAMQTGLVHEVQMVLTADGRYVYQPASLTIRVGDRVRWVNLSGGPHNVAFYRDRVPGPAVDFLTAMMTDQMSPLSGRLLVRPNEAYEISFAGAPQGRYAYFCTPHEMLGMVGELTVVP